MLFIHETIKQVQFKYCNLAVKWLLNYIYDKTTFSQKVEIYYLGYDLYSSL